MELILFVLFIVIILFCLYKLAEIPDEDTDAQKELKETLEQLGKVKQQLADMTNQYTLEHSAKTVIKEAYAKLQTQKKSSEVKTGQTVEQLAGFLDDFPYPDDEIKALYQPIDLIVFREEEIVFIEIKSGESQLSEKQRKIRDLIEEKKVRFEIHRINGKGYSVK
jgi:predicted Holliday junction resolvase-like endonuclease